MVENYHHCCVKKKKKKINYFRELYGSRGVPEGIAMASVEIAHSYPKTLTMAGAQEFFSRLGNVFTMLTLSFHEKC